MRIFSVKKPRATVFKVILLHGLFFLEIGKKLSDALEHCGFVYLENHGIPSEVMARAFGSSRKFFEQSQEKKMRFVRDSTLTQGFVESGSERLDNLKEGGGEKVKCLVLASTLEL